MQKIFYFYIHKEAKNCIIYKLFWCRTFLIIILSSIISFLLFPLVTGTDYERAVEELVNMGFGKEEVVRALQASFNNPARAVEYLTGVMELCTHIHTPSSLYILCIHIQYVSLCVSVSLCLCLLTHSLTYSLNLLTHSLSLSFLSLSL